MQTTGLILLLKEKRNNEYCYKVKVWFRVKFYILYRVEQEFLILKSGR